ncbi:MAG: transposase [Deltaproteobacteria bacterium]|nr:transposase [Deltaproteobacteria bacterium]
MVHFAGLDVHKRVVEACVLDEGGNILLRERFPASRQEIERFASRRLSKEDRVALEATTNTWPIFNILKPFVAEVVVSNPLRTRAIAESQVKTDKVDAFVLAQLLRTNFLPRVWAPDDHTRLIRRLTSRRSSLVGDRTAVKNRGGFRS